MTGTARRVRTTVAICIALLVFWPGGCAVPPETFPASGIIAGKPVSVRVDTPEAAYFLEAYLAGKRTRPALDSRIDAVYAQAPSTPAGVPDRAALKRIATEFSPDFAAIYFADRLQRNPANRRLQRAYNERLRQAGQGSGTSLPAGWRDYILVFVPGYLYKRHTETGADLVAPRDALQHAGFETDRIETGETAPVGENAAVIAEYLRSQVTPGRKVILISASKGGAEVAEALSQLPESVTRKVRAWVNIVGTIQGTPLARDYMAGGSSVIYNLFYDLRAVDSLTVEAGRARMARIRLPDSLLIINYFGVPVRGAVSEFGRDSYEKLRTFGPNDGLSLLPDLVAPGGMTLVEFGRDHYLLDRSLRERAIAMTEVVIGWLENCAGQPDVSWPERLASAPCGDTLRAGKGVID